MKKQRTYFSFTLLTLILLGISILLALEVKGSTLIAISFTSVCVLYIVIRWIAFLIKPDLKIKVLRHKNPTIVRFELNDSERNK